MSRKKAKKRRGKQASFCKRLQVQRMPGLITWKKRVGEVYPADKFVFRPPCKAAKVVRSQNSISCTGPPKTPDEGEHWKEDRPDKSKDVTVDRSTYTWDKDVEDSHVVHNTKYGSQLLLEKLDRKELLDRKGTYLYEVDRGAYQSKEQDQEHFKELDRKEQGMIESQPSLEVTLHN